MNIAETVNELEERLNAYLSEMKIEMLEYTPYIVEVGALTVGTDNNGVVILQNKNFPTQFSEKAVKILCSMKFSNGNNELVQPKVYTRHEWYSAQIEHIKSALDALGKLASLFRL